MGVPCWKVTVVVWGAAEILFFAGLVFGWASLVYILKDEGFFEESKVQIEAFINETTINSTYNSTYLPTDTPSKYQDEQLNLVYTIATVVNGVSGVLYGWIVDKFGLRILRIVGICMFSSGALMVAFTEPEISLLLYPGILLMTCAGYCILISNFQLAALIPSKRSTIISLYCGAYDSSAFILILVKFAYEGGISRQASLLFILVVFSMVIISTVTFLPKKTIPHPLPEGYKLPCICKKQQNTEFLSSTEMNGDKHNSETDDGKAAAVKELLTTDQSKNNLKISEREQKIASVNDVHVDDLRSTLLSALHIWDVIWLVCQRFRSWSYVGMLNPTLTRLAHNDKSVVSRYTSVYAMMQFCGIFLAPLSGRLMDRKIKYPEGEENIAKIEVCIPSFILNSVIGIVLTIATCIPILEVQYVSFVLHVVHRAFLYGPNSAFLAKAFRAEYFGRLFGIGISVSAAVCLLQYPLFLLVQGPMGGDPLLANLIILGLLLFALGHPIYLLWYCRSSKRNMVANIKERI